jgi:2-oxo-4-hydroxy-4-carboxy-5-ureidoimidazoline decarboxylase
MTLAALNMADRDAFVAALGWIFEHSPWVAERVWRLRPFAGTDALHSAMTSVVEEATLEEQLSLLRAHPDLGTRARVSDASRGEQSGAGLDRLTPAEFERLMQWNAAYRERFGFPFLYAVKGSTKDDILSALELRLGNSREDEFREALRQVYRIAKSRLADALS